MNKSLLSKLSTQATVPTNESGQTAHVAKVGETKQPPLQPAPVRIVESQTIFAGEREILIRHGDQEYRLRITKQDKLILMK